jgi:hypothetical protein
MYILMKGLNRNTFIIIEKEYQKRLSPYCQLSYDELVDYLTKTLPQFWVNFYEKQSNRLTDICVIPLGTFEFIYDDTDSLMDRGILPEYTKIASRIVSAYGKSSPQKINRDDYRLRGWVGPTEKIYGKNWDKGHFIAHSIGGAIDRMEINVFKQKRDLNRGWSTEGKLFRKMEEYCFQNPGTFCFNRPFYSDQTDKPSHLEFGLLKTNKELWIEFFDNQQ